MVYKLRIFFISFISTLLCLIFALMVLNIIYNYRFTYGTTINGIDVSNNTVKDAAKAFDNISNNYKILVESPNGVYELHGKDIGYHYDIENSLKRILSEQIDTVWPIRELTENKEYTIDIVGTYDDSMLVSVIDDTGIIGDGDKEESNAYISDYLDDTGKFFIIPESYGNIPIIDSIYDNIRDAVKKNYEYVDITKSSYKQPDIKSDSEDLIADLNCINDITDYNITFSANGKKFKFNREYLKSYIEYNENDGYSINLQLAIDEFIGKMNKELTTLGYGLSFVTTSGEIKSIPGGNWGWWLDREKTQKELEKLIKLDGEQLGRVYWLQTAPLYGDKEFENYIEIDLSNQHLYMYKEEKLIGDWDIVSGLDGDPNRRTPEGVYIMTYKQKDAILRNNGVGYSVEYWIPFNGNIGIHDASWQSVFGEDIYKWRGSHGCINMPLDGAKAIYDNIDKTYAIICYY